MSKGTLITTEPVRCAYFNLITPNKIVKEDGSSVEKFEVCIFLPKKCDTLARLEKAIKHEVAENGKTGYTTSQKLKDGDDPKYKEKEYYQSKKELYDGHYFLNASSKFRPFRISDKYGEHIVGTIDDDIFSTGDYLVLDLLIKVIPFELKINGFPVKRNSIGVYPQKVLLYKKDPIQSSGMPSDFEKYIEKKEIGAKSKEESDVPF